MTAKLTRLVVSCPPNHPSGQRGRAGFIFNKIPQIVDATDEQRKVIEGDPYLTVHKRTSRAWYTAHGLAFTQENIEKYAKEDPNVQEIKKSKVSGEKGTVKGKKEDVNGEGSQEETNAQQSATGAASEAPAKPSTAPIFNTFAKKEEIIEALIEFKGLKSGEGFNPEASRDALLELYKGLPDVEAKAS